MVGLATLDSDSMSALANDVLGVGALGGWDTVKVSVLGVTLLRGTASGTLAETETSLAING